MFKKMIKEAVEEALKETIEGLPDLIDAALGEILEDEEILEELLSIAQVHPDKSKNKQDVSHGDRVKALKALLELAFPNPAP